MNPSDFLHHLELRAAPARSAVELRRLADGADTIVVGPWLSEVGFEVLYWLPFVRWFADRFGVEPARMIAVSRGGAGCWYAELCAESVDVFEVFQPDDLRAWSIEREAGRAASQKQFAFADRDREVITRLLEHRGVDPRDVRVLHPSMMYRLFAPVWDGWRPLSRITGRTAHRPLPRPGGEPGRELADLDEYVAVKVYFSDCFPDEPDNRAFVRRLLAGLVDRSEVVMLSTGIRLDDHKDLDAPGMPRIHTIEDCMRPVDNLEVQSRVIAGASAFVGTYGGFSYLAPYLGTGSVSFYSRENFVPSHLDAMHRARSDLDRIAGAPFVASHLDDVRLLEDVLPLRQRA